MASQSTYIRNRRVLSGNKPWRESILFKYMTLYNVTETQRVYIIVNWICAWSLYWSIATICVYRPQTQYIPVRPQPVMHGLGVFTSIIKLYVLRYHFFSYIHVSGIYIYVDREREERERESCCVAPTSISFFSGSIQHPEAPFTNMD